MLTPWTCSSTDSDIFCWGPQGDERRGQAEEGFAVGHHLAPQNLSSVGTTLTSSQETFTKAQRAFPQLGQGNQQLSGFKAVQIDECH